MTMVILFVLGTIIGSFLNVLSLRLNSGLSLSGRSQCPHCGHRLRVSELVPIFSFIYQRGRCRACQSRISWQYPLIELWTGLVFATIFVSELRMINILSFSVFSLYIAISAYDVRHKIIPDILVYPAILLSLIFRFLVGGTTLDYLVGPILAFFFALVWYLSKGKAMGFGDAKLVLSVGFLLGATTCLSGIILSFWLGASIGLLLLLWSKIRSLSKRENGLTIKTEIPFAPFIILGSWLAMVFQLNLLHV